MLGSICAWYFLWFHFSFNSNWMVTSKFFKTSVLILNKHKKWMKTHFISLLVSASFSHRWHLNREQRNMNPLDLSHIYSFTISPWPSKTVSSFTFSEETSTLLSVSFPGMVIDLSLHKRSAAVGHLICLSALIKLKLMTDVLCWEPNIGYIVTSH